ncbi:MAG TPA: TolC family protein [Planktothrix sp.]
MLSFYHRKIITLAHAACLAFIAIQIGIPSAAVALDDQTVVNKDLADPQLRPIDINDDYKRSDIPGSTDTSGKLPLKGAIEIATDNNRDLKEAQLEVSRFKWDILAAESQRLPNVRFIGYLADNTVNSLLVPARPDAFLMLTAMLPVTQQYRYGLEARVGRLQRFIAAERFRQRLDETRSEVKTAYYKVVLDQSLLADVRENIKYLAELQATVANEVRLGNSLKVDEMQVAAKLATAKVEETKATNTDKIDCEKLNHLLGRNLDTPISLETIPPPDDLEMNPKQAEQKALSMRAEVRIADARIRQASAEKKVIWAQYIPNVSVGVFYAALPGFNNSIVPKQVLAPGIFINWNAFDWGRKAFLSAARSNVERSAKLQQQQTYDQVLIDLHTQINKLNESRQMARAAELERTAAREEMRVSINRYKFTQSRLSDVLEAEKSLSQANNSYHQALISFWEARAEFERAVGTSD